MEEIQLEIKGKWTRGLASMVSQNITRKVTKVNIERYLVHEHYPLILSTFIFNSMRSYDDVCFRICHPRAPGNF